MTKYSSYNEPDIHIMLHEPWEISDNPYKLHAAYALSCLHEAVAPTGDEDDEPFGRDDMWDCPIPKLILDRMVRDITESFNDAATSGTQVYIWGKPYTIRKRNAYDPKRLGQIFDFPCDGENYTITRNGVINLAGTTPDVLKKYETALEEARANKLYLRQVIMMAEDDENNGWDKLTDMEVAMYCWALYYHKHQSENLIEFQRLYKEHIYVKTSELKSCFIEKAILRERPQGMYTFSEAKVKRWNRDAGQYSYASKIPKDEADDYWYKEALKTTFKPLGSL